MPWPPPTETMQSHSRSHTDKRTHTLRILPAYDISYDVISMGRRRLSHSDSPQSHNTTSNTHTNYTTPHFSPSYPAFILHAPHPITPPCPSCRGTSLALCVSSTEQSGGQWHPMALPRWLCLQLEDWTQFACGFTSRLANHKSTFYWCEWGQYIFAKRSWKTHVTTKLLELNVIRYAGVNQA